MKQFLQGALFLLLLTLVACKENVYTPRPIAYYRIDLPNHSYRLFDTLYPYRFEYSKLSYIVAVKNPDQEPYWINIVYPSFNANLFVSYKKVSGNIDTLITDSKSFVSAQIQKADDIIEYHIYDSLLNVYGISYDIQGTNVASPYQFWLTDNKSHFFRASLYFNHTPNNDSVAPVIDYIKKDMLHLIETFSWK